MIIEEIASAIRNNISNGLKGVTNVSYSLQQIIDEIYLERNALIKEYSLKNLVDYNALAHALECIPVDLKTIGECKHCDSKTRHFTIPKFSEAVKNPIIYIGTTDRQCRYQIYTDYSFLYHKHNRFISSRPYVWIDTALTEEGRYNGYIFNKPLIKEITVVAIFEDLKDLKECGATNVNIPDFMKKDIIQRLSKRYVQYYRQLNQPIIQNNTQVSTT